MAFSNDQDRLMSEINVTPFVDVMLVLLIIFMVTAPMMTQGVDIDLPQAVSDPLTSEKEQLLVSINNENQIFINDAGVTLDQLGDKITKILENQPGRGVFLKADKNVPYGIVVSAMSEIKNAGVENLGIVTAPVETKADLKR